MENPRPEKVAVVNEVRERLDGAQAAILTEYRGLTVREMATLRQALVAAGGDYKVYKNTLVKLAIAGGRHEPLTSLLEGPPAIAFVSGEVSPVTSSWPAWPGPSPPPCSSWPVSSRPCPGASPTGCRPCSSRRVVLPPTE